jgi:hypothetical protein
MKSVIVIAVLAVVVAVWIVVKSRAQAPNEGNLVETKKPAPQRPIDVYMGLRNTMLHGSRAKFGLAPGLGPNDPWGVLMDWGVNNGIATVVAASDGSASVYLSGGGGYIGGKGQEPVRLAAQKAVEIARTVQLPSQPTIDFPVPETGGVFFYFLTDAGVFMFRTSVQDLKSPTHPLRTIGDAMQGVITQYRLWDKGGRRGGGGMLVPPHRGD